MSAEARSNGPQRTSRHRQRQRAAGRQRVELTIPAEDVPLLRTVADALRAGGERAAAVRERLADLRTPEAARTGEELLAFFRRSPLVGVPLDLTRDRSSGRDIDL